MLSLSSSRLFRLPRPRKFLYTMSLSTGASLITLSLLLNKVSGLYGVLALLTGYHLSPVQLSMYLYSLVALGVAAYLAPHIRRRTPLHCLALAWFYVLDSAVNAAYTALFGITWFLALARHNAGSFDGSGGSGEEEEEAVAAAAAAGGGRGGMRDAVLHSESMNSLGIIIAMWTLRLYFCVIMLAYARLVLRQHIFASGLKNTSYVHASPSPTVAENPFAQSKPEGQGWKGTLGRAMVGVGKSYWLGSDAGESWMVAMGGRLRRGGDDGAGGAGASLAKADSGPAERERRRRSGTGPPAPTPDVIQSPQKNGMLGVPPRDLL